MHPGPNPALNPTALALALPPSAPDLAALTAQADDAGIRIAFGDGPDAAHWNAATRTLTLRADADPAEHAYALGQFGRHLTLGPDFSHFTDAPTTRHLHVVR